MNAVELRHRLRRSFQGWEDKWVNRCTAPLILVYEDGSEETLHPPDLVEFKNPFSISYIWENVLLPRPLVAIRFDGAGRPARMSAGGLNTITWNVGIDWTIE